MTEPYLARWWNVDIGLGQSDDSLLLIDYFADRVTARVSDGRSLDAASRFVLGEVLDDLHLAAAPEGTSDTWFALLGGRGPREAHFGEREAVLLDLAAIVVECLRNGGVHLPSLGGVTDLDTTLRIDADPGPTQHLTRSVEAFATHPDGTDLAAVCDPDELRILVDAARELAAELRITYG